MDTALIIALVQLVSQIVQAKIAHDATTAEERAKLAAEVDKNWIDMAKAHAEFMRRANGGRG